MRVGVHLPQTEEGFGADIGAIKEFVQAAESLGYDHVLTSEHVLGPGVRHEPLVLFGYLASVTTTIKFASWIVVLPSRQATLVAKQAAEVDVLSDGRLRLGVGIGSNRVEYEGMGEAFEDRGVRCEEQIDLLRALWTQELVTFEGRWHKITDAGLNPLPIQRPIHIWMGGGPGSSGNISAGLSERALSPNPPKDRDGRREESGRGVRELQARNDPGSTWVDGRLASGLQALLGAPMAAYGGCGERGMAG